MEDNSSSSKPITKDDSEELLELVKELYQDKNQSKETLTRLLKNNRDELQKLLEKNNKESMHQKQQEKSDDHSPTTESNPNLIVKSPPVKSSSPSLLTTHKDPLVSLPKKPQKRVIKVGRLLFVAFTVICFFGLVISIINPTWAIYYLKYLSSQGSPTVIVYHLIENINSEKTLLITPDEIKAGRFMDGTISYHDLKTSMLYHMREHKFTAICALHLGVPVQYCILDMMRVLANGSRLDANVPLAKQWLSDDYIEEIFNPVLTGWSTNNQRMVEEKNSFCKERHFVQRFQWIWVDYLRPPQGDLCTRFFNETHSYNLQHIIQVHSGISGCLENSADHLITIARGRHFDPSLSHNQLLWSSPELMRTTRAESPPSTPIPKQSQLPKPPSTPEKI